MAGYNSIKTSDNDDIGSKIKSHPVFIFGSFGVIFFLAGVAAVEGIIHWSGRVVVPESVVNEAKALKDTNATITKERNMLNKQLRQIAEANQIAEIIGDDVIAYQSVDLKKQVGASFKMGSCPGNGCYEFSIVRIDMDANVIDLKIHSQGLGKCTNTTEKISLERGSKIGNL